MAASPNTAQAVPAPDLKNAIVDRDGLPTKFFAAWINGVFARLGGLVDKVDAALQTALAAATADTQVIAGGGLQGGSSLEGNVGLAFYSQSTTVASLVTTGFAEGDWAYALDGCKVGESTGAGTGVPCWLSQGAWIAVDSGSAVTA